MSDDIKQTVTKTEDQAVNETGGQVSQETKKISTEKSLDGRSTAGNFVWYIFGIVAVILTFRFVLKLFGANSASGFVDFIYDVSGIFVAPFDNIFGVTEAEAGRTDSVFEPSILVAIAVYAVVAWGIVKLLNINRSKDDV